MNFGVWQRYSRSNRAVPYLLAALLSFSSTLLTYRLPLFHSAPFALHFIATVVVAVLAGLWPSLAYILFAVLWMHYLAPHPVSWFPSAAIDLIRPITLASSAVLLNLLLEKRRQTAIELEAALAALQTQSVALIDSQQASKCASWTYGRNGHTSWSAGGYEVFGMPFAELEKISSPISFIMQEDQPAVRQAFEQMVASEVPLRVEFRTVWPNKELHWIEARGNPVPGSPDLWRGVTFDITERKLAEIALIQNEKLAAVAVSPRPSRMRSTTRLRPSPICFIWPGAGTGSMRRPKNTLPWRKRSLHGSAT